MNINTSTEILIVEDEQRIARFLSLELEHEGYKVQCIADGREALDEALRKDYDLIILDVMLPSLNGIEVLRRLRQSKDTPVIILTARDQVMDKVAGLDLGANDYMTKPFAIEELLARIRANLKKRVGAHKSEFVSGKLMVDIDARKVTYGEDPVELTKKEFDLLAYLLENRNIVISREKVLDAVWGFDFYGNTNVVDVYVRYLRSKIDDRFGISLIETVRGAGYIIRET
jgi:DNA-binding response OmpR family regulator